MLKAVRIRDGKIVASMEVSTAGDPAAVENSADRDGISADRCGVAHFTVRIVDAQGIAVPLANNEATFKIEGPEKLIGADNGDM
jgi:beta-galactosidase